MSGSAIPFTPPRGNYFFNAAQWSSDGQQVLILRSDPLETEFHLTTRPRDQSSDEQVVLTNAVGSVSRSGRYWVGHQGNLSGKRGYIAMSDSAKKFITFPEAFQEVGPHVYLSPDDSLLAYEFGEGDEPDVFVVQFPSFKGRRQVSGGGGAYPEWHQNGQELFFP
jgi:hypothetical protein